VTPRTGGSFRAMAGNVLFLALVIAAWLALRWIGAKSGVG
jgi:predicted small integral membrane protein